MSRFCPIRPFCRLHACLPYRPSARRHALRLSLVRDATIAPTDYRVAMPANAVIAQHCHVFRHDDE